MRTAVITTIGHRRRSAVVRCVVIGLAMAVWAGAVGCGNTAGATDAATGDQPSGSVRVLDSPLLRPIAAAATADGSHSPTDGSPTDGSLRDGPSTDNLGHAGDATLVPASITIAWVPPSDSSTFDVFLWTGDRGQHAAAATGGFHAFAGTARDLRDNPADDAGDSAERGGFGHLSRFQQSERFSLPVAAYTWGLFYRPSVLAARSIAMPTSGHFADWQEFQSVLVACTAGGLTPIALGSSFGWPAMAWLSYLDLRINGAVAHAALIAGERLFADPSMEAVFTLLFDMAAAGFFSADAANDGWEEALLAVVQQQAAFVLAGGYAWERIGLNAGDIAMVAFPPIGAADAGSSATGGSRAAAAADSVPAGELGQVLGIGVTADAANLPAALAVAASFAQVGPQVVGGHTFRAAADSRLNTSRAAQASAVILGATSHVLPSPDRWAGGGLAQRGFALLRDALQRARSNRGAVDVGLLAAQLDAARR